MVNTAEECRSSGRFNLPDECVSTKLRVTVNHVCFHLVTQFYTPLYTNVYWALFSSVYYNFSWLIIKIIIIITITIKRRILNLSWMVSCSFPSIMYFYEFLVVFRTEFFAYNIIDIQSSLGFRWYHCSRFWSKCTRGFEKEKRREILYPWGIVIFFCCLRWLPKVSNTFQ